ncbi:MAG TPA: DNA endonuclease SmrA, partial [Marinobacter adhaerens]|nr:DNA endonuclease SmrA [Marinobacter adhaerens]
MTTKEERLSFLEEMKDVRRIRKPNRAEVTTPRELTPGHLERQRAAVEKPARDTNPLTSDMVEPLTAHDILSWQRPGIQ